MQEKVVKLDGQNLTLCGVSVGLFCRSLMISSGFGSVEGGLTKLGAENMLHALFIIWSDPRLEPSLPD